MKQNNKYPDYGTLGFIKVYCPPFYPGDQVIIKDYPYSDHSVIVKRLNSGGVSHVVPREYLEVCK